MDAFDRFWQWADKPLESPLTIPAKLHEAVMGLAPEDRRDRAAVNDAASRIPDPERGTLERTGPYAWCRRN